MPLRNLSTKTRDYVLPLHTFRDVDFVRDEDICLHVVHVDVEGLWVGLHIQTDKTPQTQENTPYLLHSFPFNYDALIQSLFLTPCPLHTAY